MAGSPAPQPTPEIDIAAAIAAGPQAAPGAAGVGAQQPIGGYAKNAPGAGVGPVGPVGPLGPYGPQDAEGGFGPDPSVGAVPGPETGQGVIYYEGDEVALFAGASYEDKYRMQRALVEAGLLTTGFRPGMWDTATRGAMTEALGYANEMGVPWERAVARLASETMVAPKPKPLVPNTRELSEIVKATFQAHLKRDPSKAEVAELAGHLGAQYRQAASGGEDFVPEGIDGDLPDYETEVSPLDEDPETDEADILAEFEGLVERKYAGEIEGVQTADDYRAQDPSGVFDAVGSAMAQQAPPTSFVPTPEA